jgi:predicted metal-binding membrane protein
VTDRVSESDPAAQVSPASPSALEKLLVRDRLAVVAGLAGAIALSWLYLVPASRDMYGAMDGLSAWMMAGTWDARYFLLICLMWAVMMVGMMLPSAAPTLLLFATVLRRSDPKNAPVARTYAFAGGYLFAWTAFSLAATFLQWALAKTALLSPMMITNSRTVGALILMAAGVYQWTPLKRSCLARCRAPAEFLSRHFRPGSVGALRMGTSHGLYCVGCCWALMLLLFFGGVMSLTWIAAITVFVLLEKLAPFGAQGGRLSGTLLLLAACGVMLLKL